MCVIITTPGREERPSLRQLELCERANRHGSGLAWLKKGMVQYAKGLSVPQIHQLLHEIEGPAIVHFRIASIGRVCPELCHPFPVTLKAELKPVGQARAVLFQNGTWPGYQRYMERLSLSFGRREPVSDTRAAASFVSRFGFGWLRKADFCRWALLDSRGIHRIGRWSKIGECHFSNLHWMTGEESDFWDLLEVE